MNLEQGENRIIVEGVKPMYVYIPGEARIKNADIE